MRFFKLPELLIIPQFIFGWKFECSPSSKTQNLDNEHFGTSQQIDRHPLVFFNFSLYAGPCMDLFKCCNGEWYVQTTETHVSAPGNCSTCPSACSSCEASQRSIVALLNRMHLIPYMSDTWPKIDSSEQANSNKTFCPGRLCNLLYRDLILAISKSCLLNSTVLPTAAGDIPALNGKSSGWTVASSISDSTGASAGLSSTEWIPVSVAVLCPAWLGPSTGVSGDLSTFAAFSALTNMSNPALHLLLCLPSNSEPAWQSGVAPKRIMRSRVIYSCRTAGDASNGRLENGTSFGR